MGRTPDELVVAVDDGRLHFLLSLNRHHFDLRFHFRTCDRHIGRVRLDAAPYHLNPDATELRHQPQLHVYRAGHELAFAQAVDWYDVTQPLATLARFLDFIHTTFSVRHSAGPGLMAAKPQFDLARDYGAWLRERLVNVDYGEIQSLSTPLLDPFNDGIEIFIEPRGGELVLHDHGRTLANLLDLGVRIEDSERRQALIDRVTASCGVRLVDGRLETHASSASLPQRAHLLLTSIVRLNDLWMSAVPHRWVDFLELVAEFLDERQVLYSRDVSVQRRTVAHEIDFLIPLPRQRERLVKVMGSPSPQTAKVLSFTWMDLREARPNAERVVVLNDTRTPDPLEGETVAEARRVSEQVIAILRGYSSDVVRWSERGEPQFRRLWQAA